MYNILVILKFCPQAAVMALSTRILSLSSLDPGGDNGKDATVKLFRNGEDKEVWPKLPNSRLELVENILVITYFCYFCVKPACNANLFQSWQL